MKIFIGADHQGFAFKNELTEELRRSGHEAIDEGDKQLKPEDDFPQFAGRVARAMQKSGDASARGILLCGSGQGMAMAANRFRGIRASLCWDVRQAHLARNDDDSNVLCLPAGQLNKDKLESIVHVWLTTPFAEAPRYKRRIKELDELG